MNNEQMQNEILRLSNEVETLKSIITGLQIETKNNTVSPTDVPTTYTRDINLSGNAATITVLAYPNRWMKINTPYGFIKIPIYQ